jgi:hypothetical protein
MAASHVRRYDVIYAASWLREFMVVSMYCRRLAIRCFPLVLLCVAGCVTQSTSGDETTVRYSWWLPVTIFLAGLAVIPVGAVLRRHTARLGWGLLIGGPVAAIVFAPMLAFESVTVNDRGFAVRSGFFGRTAAQDVSFIGMRQIQIMEEMTTGRGARMIDVLVCQPESGEAIRLPLNNDVKIEGGAAIIVRARVKGIPVHDARH